MRMPRLLLGCLLAALFLSPLTVRAEENAWATDESTHQDLELVLTSGETVRGRMAAETADSVILTVLTDKGKVSQTVQKADVKTHAWVPTLDAEARAKLAAWPIDQYPAMLTYAQTVVDKGFKSICVEALTARRKELTADSFQNYVCFLLNNNCVTEARSAVDWAKKDHPDWKDAIQAMSDRLPVGAAANANADAAKPGAEAAIPSVPGVWLTSFTQAKRESAATKKPILALFTGSDWCPWCKKLEAEVFATATFKTWAGKKVILLKLDFPDHTPQPAAVTKQNEELSATYAVHGYPSVLFLSAEGTAYSHRTGYFEGGPQKWVDNADLILAAH